MVIFAQQMLQVLFAEVMGVAATAGVIYFYWNAMTKDRHTHS